MIAGSFASTFYGEPRTTHDVDIVIDPTRAALQAFVAALPPVDYYVDLDAALDAFRRRSQFNVIDMSSGWKIDLIIRRSRAFSIEEFGRRREVELLGTHVFMATAEDTILAKLEWAHHGESERQLRDVESMLAVSGELVDRAYVDRWAAELGLDELWARVQAAD